MNRWVDAVWRWVVALAPLVVGLGLALPSAATPTLEQEQEIRASFVTPHTPWAKPYAGGMTRVLFFSDYKNTQAREIVELMQRFEVRADAAYYTRVKIAKKPTCTINLSRFNRFDHPCKRDSAVFYPLPSCAVEGNRC